MSKTVYTVLLVLVMLASCSGGGRYSEMRQRLEALNALNRAGSVLTATERDEAQALADYFDSHGTPNDQMLAHYLLGRCYADMREAPMALHCYQEAITRADTLSPDCDFAQLSRVYGQSSAIFYQQGLYRNAMEYDDMSAKYGWLGKDTLNALRSYAMKAASYDQLQMKDSAILIYEDAIRQMKAYKYNKVAAGFSLAVARLLTEKGIVDKAAKYYNEYEHHSGFFDSTGNIERRREIFYYLKGLYCLKTNQPDSVEYYFRKELRTGKDFNNQSAGAYGLSLLYQRYNNPDSTAKYAIYYSEMNDSVYAQRATQEVEQAKTMYDYTRQQELAQRKEVEANKERTQKERIIYISLALLCLMGVILTKWNQKKKEYQTLRATHQQAEVELQSLRHLQTINSLVVATHGLVKKTWAVPANEIAKAEAIRKEYYESKEK